MRILEAVDAVNKDQADRFVVKIKKHFGNDLSGKRMALWGLAFKPRTNDMREAPAIRIIESLQEAGAAVTAYDPEATEEAKKIFGDRVQYAPNNYACLEGADALVVVTEWQVFRNPNFERMKATMRQSVVFDGRNIFEPGHMRQLGFTYYSIGRK
jgi:UDPglucose 6-dehydrogenase